MRASASAVRLTDLLDALSLAVDLGLGQPMRHVARSAAIAERLAALLGLDADQQADLMHVSRLGWLGCIAESRDAARWFGDDIDYRSGVYDLDMRPLPFLGYLLRTAGSADPPPTRLAKRAGVLLDGGRSVQRSLRAHCQVTANIASRLGLNTAVCQALGQIFARWDGKGLPDVGGEDVALVVRLWHVADVAEVHARRGGPAAAEQVLRARSGTQFDPQIVELFCTHSAALLTEPLTGSAPPIAAAGAPDTFRPLTDAELDHALAVTGDWVDLKSPWFSGHSRGVAELAHSAAIHLGMDAASCDITRRAGFTHDLGRTGVSNRIWDQSGGLSGTDLERVRLHSYYTERMLVDQPALAAIGRVAGMCHERLDGSGYHRGLTAPAIPMEARVLAAADCFHTKLEARPHRAALNRRQAAEHLAQQARAGRLDKDACDAVLEVAGEARTGVANPAGLTAREVEVLRLLAVGHTNRQIADRLSISPKTVSNHVEHLYAKAGVSTRAAAALFAMEHTLVDPLTAASKRG